MLWRTASRFETTPKISSRGFLHGCHSGHIAISKQAESSALFLPHIINQKSINTHGIVTLKVEAGNRVLEPRHENKGGPNGQSPKLAVELVANGLFRHLDTTYSDAQYPGSTRRTVISSDFVPEVVQRPFNGYTA